MPASELADGGLILVGVLVQAKEQCRRAHFWVLIAPERHVLYAYSPRHDSAAVDAAYGKPLIAEIRPECAADEPVRAGDEEQPFLADRQQFPAAG